VGGVGGVGGGGLGGGGVGCSGWVGGRVVFVVVVGGGGFFYGLVLGGGGGGVGVGPSDEKGDEVGRSPGVPEEGPNLGYRLSLIGGIHRRGTGKRVLSSKGKVNVAQGGRLVDWVRGRRGGSAF